MSSPALGKHWILISSVQFVHQTPTSRFSLPKNLEVLSEGFAGADAISDQSSSDNIVVPMTETSTLLDLLLQYMYCQPQPDLKQVNFQTSAGVAEAAEK